MAGLAVERSRISSEFYRRVVCEKTCDYLFPFTSSGSIGIDDDCHFFALVRSALYSLLSTKQQHFVLTFVHTVRVSLAKHRRMLVLFDFFVLVEFYIFILTLCG